MSESLPFPVNTNPFEKTIRGVFGRFQTKDSYRLYYLLASLPFVEIDQLLTAAEAITITDPEVSFAQLIQRDIDYERVNKMVIEYLEEGKNRVVFFPPLLVSLLGMQDGHVVKKYQSATPSFEGQEYSQTWESGFFRLTLPTTDQNTGASVSDGKSTRFIFNFGAKLQYNPRLVKLVVIDGQHRLQALKALKNKSIVDTIEIPVCVVFVPDALASTREEVTLDLRELFVTINQEATKVSGHFITLLDDKTLTSALIRYLGDFWKNEIAPNGYTPLQLLEWNQRHSKLAAQVTRDHSITTVSIIADALRVHLFEHDLKDRVFALLNLNAIKTQLEKVEDGVAADEISDANFHTRQLPILEVRMKSYLVPAINTLFRSLRPYKVHEEKVRKAFDWVNEEIAKGSVAAGSFKADVLQQFRDTYETDPERVRSFGESFASRVQKDAEDSRFFYNVFQQGLIRCWIKLSFELARHEVTPTAVAKALVPALDEVCFSPKSKLFSTEQAYVRRVLFNGERVLLGNAAKDGWYSLIVASLGSPKNLAAFCKGLEDCGETIPRGALKAIAATIKQTAVRCAQTYLERYKQVTQDDLTRNYFERDLPKSTIDKLTQLDRSKDEKDHEEFDEEILKLAEKRRAKALEILSNILSIEKAELAARAD